MAQTINFNCDAQSPAESLVDSAGNPVSNGVSFVNGDTRVLNFYARSGGAASSDYTPTTHNLRVTLGQPGSSSSAISYATATASTGSGDYWAITLVISAAAITTLVADGRPHEATLEAVLVARTGGAEFTPILKAVQIYPGIP